MLLRHLDYVLPFAVEIAVDGKSYVILDSKKKRSVKLAWLSDGSEYFFSANYEVAPIQSEVKNSARKKSTLRQSKLVASPSPFERTPKEVEAVINCR